MRGHLITFEGGEGAGKSTQMARLADRLRADGVDVLTTREPGGSAGAEAIRHMILSGAAEPFGATMEATLFAAARSDNVTDIIRPALEHGRTVLCDRYIDSSRVYQGMVGQAGLDFVRAMERVVTEGARPDLTLIFDIDPEVGLTRAAREGEADRFERDTLDEQAKRRAAFLAIAEEEPERCVVIDAAQDAARVADAVEAAYRALVARGAEAA